MNLTANIFVSQIRLTPAYGFYRLSSIKPYSPSIDESESNADDKHLYYHLWHHLSVWIALLREKANPSASIDREAGSFAALCRGGTAAAPFGFSLLSLSSRWFDFLFNRRCLSGVTTGKSVQGGIDRFLDRAYFLYP